MIHVTCHIPYVKKDEHKNGTVPLPRHIFVFHMPVIIFDERGKVGIFIREILPQEWVEDMEVDVWSEDIRKLAKRRVDDCRGFKLTVDFGL